MDDMKFKLTIDLSEFAKQLAKAEGDLSKLPEDITVSISADGDQAASEADEVEKEIDEIPDEKDTEITANSGDSVAIINAVSNAYMALNQAINQVKALTAEYIDKANTQEKAEKHLQIALAQTGDKTIETFNHFKKYAAQIQDMTTVGDEVIMPVMRLGLNMGVLTDNLEEATQGAIGLSKGFNLDLNMAMKMHVLATQGDFNMLQRYIPALRQATTDAEKMAIVKQAEADGWAVATKEIDTGFGKLEDYSNTIGDVQEKFGNLLKEALYPIVDVFNTWLGLLDDAMSKSFSDELRDEQIEFTALIRVLQDANTLQSSRNQAIEILQNQYSDYLGNIDLEKAGYEDLAEALKNANIEFERKIALAAAEELLEAQKRKLLSAEKDLLDMQVRLAQFTENNQHLQRENYDAYLALSGAIELQKSKVQNLQTAFADYYNALMEQGLIPDEIKEEVAKFTSTISENLQLEGAEPLINASDLINLDYDNIDKKGEDAFIALIKGFVEATQDGTAELVALGVKIIDKITPSDDAIAQTRIRWGQVLSMSMEYVSATSNLFGQLYDYRSNRLQQAMQAEIEAVEQSTRSEEEKRAQIEKIQDKYEKKEAAERAKQKPVMIAQAIANTALGVTKALSKLNIPLAIIIAASGAIEIAKIAAQKFGKGGPIEGERQVIEVNENGPEYIINAEATKQWKPLLDFINFGRSDVPGMTKISYETGGIVNNSNFYNSGLMNLVIEELRASRQIMEALNYNFVNKKDRLDISINGKKVDQNQIEEFDNLKVKMTAGGYDGKGESLSL